MNTLPASSPRPVATERAPAHVAPALVAMARSARDIPNDTATTAVANRAANPLWMITAGLATLFTAMALLMAAS